VAVAMTEAVAAAAATEDTIEAVEVRRAPGKERGGSDREDDDTGLICVSLVSLLM
jgi:hypothetical protein